MFFQLPEEQSQSTITLPNKPRPRRKKKISNKKKQKQSFKKKQSKFAITMSSWANDFITASTWQMKHQIAYWKSKARALEYENRILHEIIRKNTTHTTNFDSIADISVKCERDVDNEECNVENEECENDNFEVSDEFIEFLRANAKYKEDARMEREKLKAKMNEKTNEIMDEPPQRIEHSIEQFKELYGKYWQRIAALEMSLQGDYIEKTDKNKPMYWPNIPLNFNFS